MSRGSHVIDETVMTFMDESFDSGESIKKGIQVIL